MTDIYDESLTETVEEPEVRLNPFCVISKATYGDHAGHDIQTNSGWTENPYGDDYAVVPDDMVPAIMETKGFCDIVLSEDGAEVVSFTAREIPAPDPVEPTVNPGTAITDTEMAAAIMEGVNEV